VTLATTSNTVVAQGNGLTTSFDFTFPVPLASELFVYYTTTAGVTSLLPSNSYTVTGIGTDDGGAVTYPVSGGPIPQGSYLTIQRIVPYQQLTSLVNQSGYYPNVVENALDYLTMQTQQLAQGLQLSLQVPLAASSANLVLPSASARAGQLVGFDSNGNAITYPLPASVGAGNMTAEPGSNGRPGFKSGADFTGGTTTTLTLSQSYGTVANVLVAFDGVYVEKDSYTLNGDQITFGSWSGSTFTPSPIPNGVQNVDVVGGTTLSAYVPGIGSVTAQSLAAGAVTTPAIAAGAVVAASIATGAVSTKLNTEATNQLTTGEYYSDLGARIMRFNDRILLGAATIGDGKQSPTTRDWMDALITPSTSTGQLAVLSTVGETAVFGGTRSSDAPTSGTEACIGVVGICINNATGATQQVGFGGYFEVDQEPNAGFSAALEVDSANQSGTVVALTPYSLFPSGAQPCVNAWFAAGGARSGVVNSSAGLVFLQNGAQFDKGIIFQGGAIASNEAIAFAQNHAMQWWASSTVPSGFINSTASTYNFGIAITDAGIYIGNSPSGSSNATASLEAVNVVSAANYVSVYGSIAGVSPTIAASGSDTNINLSLSPKGTGLLGFGGATASSATSGSGSSLPSTPAGYLEFILNSNGITYKIPYYNV
jgi:hypothetical protein